MKPADLLRSLPAVDEVMRRPEVAALAEKVSPVLLASWVREALAEIRADLLGGRAEAGGFASAVGSIPARIAGRAARLETSPLTRVINASGILVHTNLGRAPLALQALESARAAGASYIDLEYDLERGERGSRSAHLEESAAALFPGQALFAVNNNAAAVLLVLNSLAEGREVVLSRGELVEIGGSFRIPDVMVKAGAVLREVGTTNRTRVADYRAAIGPRTALLAKVHTSNYRIVGFVEEASVAELVELGRETGLPVFMDEGSGNLHGAGDGPLGGEPSVLALLAAGASLVSFSGDKLLGGPQAGLIVGTPELVAKCAKNPLARALRVDKLTMAALAWTLFEHAAGRARRTIPVLRMLGLSPEEVGARAKSLAARLEESGALVESEVVAGESRIGGGAAPLRAVPTRILALRPLRRSTAAFEEALRKGDPPIVARVERERLLVDLRTVDPAEDESLAIALDAASR